MEVQSRNYVTDQKPPAKARALMDLADRHGWSYSQHWGLTNDLTPFYRLTLAARNLPTLAYGHVVLVWHTNVYPVQLSISTMVYRTMPGGFWKDVDTTTAISRLIQTGSVKPGP